MIIAVFSDIHENLHNLLLALEIVKERQVEQILFLGDFMNTGIARTLAKATIPVLAVWGNNDGEKVEITKVSMAAGSALTLSSNVYDFVSYGGKRIFLSHYPDIAKSMAKSGDYDAVFYGHNHIVRKDNVNACLVVNPGEISAHKTGIATFALYNTEQNDIEIVTIPNSITLLSDKVRTHREDAGFTLAPTKSHQF